MRSTVRNQQKTNMGGRKATARWTRMILVCSRGRSNIVPSHPMGDATDDGLNGKLKGYVPKRFKALSKADYTLKARFSPLG